MKCRKALWLQAREALWSNCKQTLRRYNGGIHIVVVFAVTTLCLFRTKLKQNEVI